MSSTSLDSDCFLCFNDKAPTICPPPVYQVSCDNHTTIELSHTQFNIIKNCKNLTTIVTNGKYGSSLTLINCPNLTIVPSLPELKELEVKNCTLLETIGEMSKLVKFSKENCPNLIGESFTKTRFTNSNKKYLFWKKFVEESYTKTDLDYFLTKLEKGKFLVETSQSDNDIEDEYNDYLAYFSALPTILAEDFFDNLYNNSIKYPDYLNSKNEYLNLCKNE